MEKRCLYTLKDIIFGLRKIYLEHEHELSSLKENEKEFFKLTKRLLTSSFVLSTSLVKEEGIKSLCENGTLYLDTNNIVMSANPTSALPSVIYSAPKDTLTFTSSDDDLQVSKYGIKAIMDSYFFYKSFPDYHLTSINESALEKPLVITHFEPTGEIAFSIEEKEKQITLSKIK